MGQQHDQRGLAHVGGLAAHVGAGDDQHASLIVEVDVVGDERVFQYLFDHQVTAALDVNTRGVDKRRACQPQLIRAFGQGGEHVQLRQGRGGGSSGSC